jgi:hypothetical protein
MALRFHRIDARHWFRYAGRLWAGRAFRFAQALHPLRPPSGSYRTGSMFVRLDLPDRLLLLGVILPVVPPGRLQPVNLHLGLHRQYFRRRIRCLVVGSRIPPYLYTSWESGL